MGIFDALFGRKSGPPTRPAQCPNCHRELTVCFVDEFALSRCDGCRGLYCTSDDFEKIIAKPDADLSEAREMPDTDHTFRASVSARGCPQCGEPMHNYMFRSQVWLDSCAHGHGIWLDRGELAMVQQARQAASQLSPAEKEAMGRAFVASTEALYRGAEEMRRFNEAQARAREDYQQYQQPDFY